MNTFPTASGIVLAELVLYIDETRIEEGRATVFKLADLAHLYQSRMEQLGFKFDTRVHFTRIQTQAPCRHTTRDSRHKPCSSHHHQLLKFTSIKHKWVHNATTSVTERHSTSQETPVPLYMGMMLHAHTRNRELVDRLPHLGPSISYDRVLRLSAQMGINVCQQFHNTSATTAKTSFHGTSISLLQHSSFPGEGVDRSIVILGRSENASSTILLAIYHTTTQMCFLLILASRSHLPQHPQPHHWQETSC
ncbi:hypothetical protein Hamer_G010050 [Homarus americanus]|uniref:Uncharacterized protein n=1 Tax=Homarus americanus TaxID=6706 RepID=A0A8J5JHB4_HOMAM|nr:hypothetical protein Hamer_G010050 [Homarus americanus]